MWQLNDASYFRDLLKHTNMLTVFTAVWCPRTACVCTLTLDHVIREKKVAHRGRMNPSSDEKWKAVTLWLSFTVAHCLRVNSYRNTNLYSVGQREWCEFSYFSCYRFIFHLWIRYSCTAVWDMKEHATSVYLSGFLRSSRLQHAQLTSVSTGHSSLAVVRNLC